MNGKSPDLQGKIAIYHNLLMKWQESINLVSENSLQEAEKRHFQDSLQLAAYLPEKANVFDLGSGAGFPGLVLAMARPDLEMTLIESDQKKCTFLSTVSRETKTSVMILNQRIEDVDENLVPDILTARALASVHKILGYAQRWLTPNPELSLLLLKGEKVEEEIESARKKYDFETEIFPSTTGSGFILQVTNIASKSEY